MALCFWAGWVQAESTEETVDASRDSLVYKDGDRVYGKYVQRVGDVIVFKSDRFGELRVPAADAVVIKASPAAAAALAPAEPAAKTVVAQGIKPAPAPDAAATKAPETAEERADKERISIWNAFSPAVLTAKVREFFGPWHGRISVSTDFVQDVSDRSGTAIDGKIARKFTKDTVEVTARYDYNKTNDVRTSDTIKGAGSWRHDFSRRWFAQYRPTVEWNRMSRKNGVIGEYVLLQQEGGVGVNVMTKPSRKLRLGVSQNLFDIWTYYGENSDHGSRGVESFFDELELTLPWRMTLLQRGAWYPVPDDTDGWENRIELNKKLTETLSVAVRHELRRNNPDGSSLDYTRLKLLLGFDF